MTIIRAWWHIFGLKNNKSDVTFIRDLRVCIVLSCAFWKAFRPKPPVIALRVIYAKDIPIYLISEGNETQEVQKFLLQCNKNSCLPFVSLFGPSGPSKLWGFRPSTPQKTSMEQRPLHGDPLKAIFSEGLLFFVAFLQTSTDGTTHTSSHIQNHFTTNHYLVSFFLPKKTSSSHTVGCTRLYCHTPLTPLN